MLLMMSLMSLIMAKSQFMSFNAILLVMDDIIDNINDIINNTNNIINNIVAEHLFAHKHPEGTSVISSQKTTRSVISVHILVLVSMRKYILNHK